MLATAQLVDIDAVYAKAKEVVEVIAPGSALKPIEPSDREMSPQAVAVTVTSPDGTDVFIVDAVTADAAAFDPTAAIEALLGALGEDLDLTALPAADVGDLAAFDNGSSFRAALMTGEAAAGEFRFSIAGPAAPAADDTAAPPPEQPAQEAPQAQSPLPDMTQLASRLPNLAAVDMDVTVELGRVRLPIKELLGLGSGSVVRLGTPIGDSFDILVNGKAAARGDLVVVGGKLAVRIRELLGIQA